MFLANKTVSIFDKLAVFQAMLLMRIPERKKNSNYFIKMEKNLVKMKEVLGISGK